jgi:hypothetical protein
MQKIYQTDKNLIKLKIEEFKRGKNPDGSIIGTYRSNSYSNFKKSKNPLARGFVDLINTGSYVNKLYVKKVNKLQYQFVSRDSKDKMLADKYGQQIRGLSKHSLINSSEHFARSLGMRLRKKIGL